MKYYIDTGDIEEVRKWSRLIHLEGVTSNPVLLDYTKKENIQNFVKEALKCVQEVFIQARSVEEFRSFELAKFPKDRIIVKIPASLECMNSHFSYEEGYFPVLSGYRNSATMVYNVVQLNEIVNRRFNYSMIYVSKNDNSTFLEDAMKISTDTKFIAASFRQKSEVVRAIKSGIYAATIPPSVLEKMFENLEVERDFKLSYEK